MRLVEAITAFVDRDVNRWNGTPVGSWGIGLVPLLAWGLVIGVPGDARPIYLWSMIGFAGFWLGVGSWRMAIFEWKKFKHIRALGAAEELERSRNG